MATGFKLGGKVVCIDHEQWLDAAKSQDAAYALAARYRELLQREHIAHLLAVRVRHRAYATWAIYVGPAQS